MTGDDGHGRLGEWNHFNDVLGAGLGAGCAARALIVVHGRQAIVYVDGVELTGSHTIAIAHATEFAGLDIGQGIGRSAALNAFVLGIVGTVVNVRVTVDHRTKRCSAPTHRQAENLCDLFCSGRSTWGTFADEFRISSHSLGIGTASCKATRTAVHTRQGSLNGFHLGIHLDLELFTGHQQDQRKQTTQTQHHQTRRPRTINQLSHTCQYHEEIS